MTEGQDGGVERPTVSVILPTYDRPDRLRDAIRSVTNQTYTDIELVVVDDHSDVPADTVVESSDTDGLRITIHRHETNRGPNAARITGISQAEGQLLAFLDDDDRWLPTKLEKQVAVMRSSPDIGVVYTGQQYLNEHGDVTGVSIPSAHGQVTKHILERGNVGPFSTLMVHKRAIEAAGLPDVRFPSFQDWEWAIRLSREVQFEPVREPLVVRLIHTDEQVTDQYERKRDVTYPLLIEKHRGLAASLGPLTERRFIAAVSASLASAALTAGAYADAVTFACRSIRFNPMSVTGYLYLFAAVGGDHTYTVAKRASQLRLQITAPELGSSSGRG